MEKDHDNRPLMVTIICTAYNHEQYIRECLEGFVIQKTNFRFEAVVHDDASTDGTAKIIREYAERYPDIIKPIFETENQYSKADGSLVRILDNNTHGKYVAQCEGDDYWIDPYKLQKQYDYLESHPECKLCFHANYRLYPSGKKIVFRPKKIKSVYSIKDAILGGGTFMAYNSMFYQWNILRDTGRPKYWEDCPIGDLPMMLYFASKGDLGYIDEVMSVYRVGAQGSWTTSQNTLKKRRAHYKAIIKMFNQYDEYTGFKYHWAIIIKKNKNTRNHIKSNVVLVVYNLLKRIGIKI